MSYFSRFSQNVTASSINSSTANLTSGAIFTGTADSTLSANAIQVSLYTDQNCTVWVDQSPDTTPTGPHWDLSDSYNYYANENFGITVQAISSYVRVRVQNLNTSTATTFFRLQTVLCPIVEAVPRSLDEFGNLKTSIDYIKDNYGFTVENTPIGEMRTAQVTRLVGSIFDGTTVDSNFWTVTNANGGTTTQANAEITLATNTTANGSTKVNSVRRARYVSGIGICYRTVIQLSSGVINNKRRWGIAYGSSLPTITDGAYFELDGTTFSVVIMKGSSETRVSSGNFNGKFGKTYSSGTVAVTYEIYWTNSKVWFAIGNSLLHTVTASSSTWASTMSHYIYMDNVNSNSITSNNTLECRVSSIKRLGQLLTQPTHKYQSGITPGIICKYGPGNLHSILISAVPTSGAIITIYDGTTTGGNIIASFTITFPGGGNFSPIAYDMKGVPFFVGLFFVISTQTANVTLIYE